MTKKGSETKKEKLINFTRGELILWISSLLAITISFLIFDRSGWLSLIASLIGATSLIFCAKGDPIGQALIILFSLIYGYISWTFAYYGEMITYAGMTLPMAIFALISWIRHPYKKNSREVAVCKVRPKDILLVTGLAAIVTLVFYFILKYFNTANLYVSTLSVTTSFIAVYLTFRRSPYYAIAYAVNDIVLIILWAFATLRDPSYISVLVCFITFLFNDLYGFINWKRIEKRQLLETDLQKESELS